MAASVEQAMEMLNLTGRCTHADVQEIFQKLSKDMSERATTMRKSREVPGDTKHHVCEMYSPPRICKTARRMNLRGGWSLDLTTRDEDGVSWDFGKEERRAKAKELIEKDRPNVQCILAAPDP